MEIKGKVHCFFEQSGTFKNEFKKLGYEAYDYDIQNNFDETDYVIDLFAEIESAYSGGGSVFDKITKDDLIIAFFPYIYFTGANNPCYFTLQCNNYVNLTLREKLDSMLIRAKNRESFYELIIKLVGVCLQRELRLIIENPFSTLHFLSNNFLKAPTLIDNDRTLRGDYFKKPTGYWFFNCDATNGYSYQPTPKEKIKNVFAGKQLGGNARPSKQAGLCSEERSMISPDYVRNFICDFILGKEQDFGQMKLF